MVLAKNRRTQHYYISTREWWSLITAMHACVIIDILSTTAQIVAEQPSVSREGYTKLALHNVAPVSAFPPNFTYTHSGL